MAKRTKTQAVVIGAGPGGYVCAIRLAQLGVSTLLIEKENLGGVCLNVGCIPSKALISASKLLEQIREADKMGIEVGEPKVKLEKMLAWKRGIVKKLTSGVEQLVNANGASILRGSAQFTGSRTLSVTSADGQVTPVDFDYAVIATGSVPATIPGFAIDGKSVVSSTGAMELGEIPKTMVVVGGGYIGMELGSVYQRLGTNVTVVEYADRILAGFESDLARPVERRFKKLGGKIKAKTMAVGWKKRKNNLAVEVKKRDKDTKETLTADVILLTVGRTPCTTGLDCQKAGVAVSDRGFIDVDGEQRTNVPHIFAIGDVAGEPMLAHKASKEGEIAAEVIAGHPAAFDLKGVPAVVFTDPEIAAVGLTVAEAKAAGYDVKTGKFSFAANGRALSLGDTEGFIRVVVDKSNDVLLGFQAVGPEVSNLLAEGGLALEMGALAQDVGWTIHAHPTLSEVIMEAANSALGQAIHAVNPR